MDVVGALIVAGLVLCPVILFVCFHTAAKRPAKI
jgi:hypothetical protein